MKELPDEETMLSLLKEFKGLEQAARKLSGMTTATAYKCQEIASGTYNPDQQKRLCEILKITRSLEKQHYS